MAVPPDKDSRRQQFMRPFQRGYNKLANLANSPSRPSSPLPDNSAAIPAGVGPNSPAVSYTQGPDITNPLKPQASSVVKNPIGPTALGTSPTLTTFDSVHVTMPGSTTIASLGEAGSMASSGLGKSLRVFEKSTEAFPPLKQALGGLIACLDSIQLVDENVEGHKQIILELTTMTNTLGQYMTELGPEDSNGTIERISESLEEEAARIKERQTRNTGRRWVESAQDQEDLIKSYRKIEGLFRELHGDIAIRIWRNTSKLPLHRAMYLLKGMEPVEDAMYNSGYSTTVKRRGCTPETRQKVQADIQHWIQDPNGAKVYWMNGMAGTGKTTIAYSVCEWLKAKQLLGASFFCSRASSACRNVNTIVPTIAYQLAIAWLSFQLALCKLLEADPSISKLNVAQQTEDLLRKPLLLTLEHTYAGPKKNLVIVIDALDECEDDYGVRLILGALLKLGTGLPLKFLITSRPEPAIQDKMLSPTKYSPLVLHLHDIEQSVVEDDIKKYLIEALGDMSPAPSSEQIDQLAKLAGKLFIYAATTARYIMLNKGNPTARLKAMLVPHSQTIEGRPSIRRYKELDTLYTIILASAFNDGELETEETEAIQLVLWTAVCAKEPMSIPTLASFLYFAEEDVVAALSSLHSVLHVSDDRTLVSTLHASFADYILNHHRSGVYYCDQVKHNQLLADRCLVVMEEQLRFNICELKSSFTSDTDVCNLGQKIEAHISPALFYACQHWSGHLQLAVVPNPNELCKKLVGFLDVRLLFWVELLNITGRISAGVLSLSHTEAWLSAVNANADIRRRTVDARDFLTRFAAGACNRSTPHIYISALPFCARTSSVYEQYWKRTKGLIGVRGTAVCQRDRASRATWKENSAILSVALSHDGTRIVSGSSKANTQVWDIHTGNVVAGPFEGHNDSDSITSVAFSPDNTSIVSGSSDRTIRVWDARTADIVLGPLEGHTDWVRSVGFSPDGAQIVSGSDDQTIRLWDAYTGNDVAGPLKGHTDYIRSVAFSPQGTHIVSGSDDRTIRLWDARTGAVAAEPLKGHTGYVMSVAFSPDGTRIVSGSYDTTVRVWHACTSHVPALLFEGHTEQVTSAVFSHEGARVVSGSGDRTIRVWDSQTGDTIAGPFIGHTGWVNSIAVSPDGTYVVSGSSDKTIRVWDAHGNNVGVSPYKTLEAGHSHGVSSVASSPGGMQVASGSYDKTIRIWDIRTGDMFAGPFKGHAESVRSVAFSPDGTCVASGSDDQTIRVWDVRSGDISAGPFEGHTDLIRSIAFSPDGAHIASGSRDRTIRVWEARTGAVAAGPLEGHGGGVRSVDFSPDGTCIVSGSNDQTIRVWSAHTGEVVAGPFEGHTDWVNTVTFSPDGTRIASGSNDRKILVWDARRGDVVAGPFEHHTSYVNSVAFSPDGAQIVSGSDDQAIFVLDSYTGRVVAGPFKGHTGPVNSVAFSPDGMSIVSGSDDQAIRVCSVNHTSSNWGLLYQLHRHEIISESNALNAPESDPSLNANPDGPSVDMRAVALITPQSSTPTDFECHDDGWVTSNGAPLFWTPPDLRSHIPYPQDRVVIGHQGSLSIDYQYALFGERWTECYRSS